MLLVERALRGGAALGIKSPGVVLLAALRRRALEETVAAVRPRGDALSADLAAGQSDARDALGELAASALHQMRRRVRTLAADRGPLVAACAALDDWWGSPTEGEYIDDEDLDEAQRSRAMSELDAINDLLCSYDRFLDELAPLMAPNRPTRVLDLAAGHGGFALAVARIARERGLSIEITATDIKREYLDLGEVRARSENLAVRFVVQDALDLSNLAVGEHDIVVCTQATHHFPPGLVARMFESAARVAGRGVVFVDGCRSLLMAAPITAFARFRYGNRLLAHDAYISFRSFYVPEELELLARIGAWGDGVETRWLPPSHCLLRWRKPGV